MVTDTGAEDSQWPNAQKNHGVGKNFHLWQHVSLSNSSNSKLGRKSSWILALEFHVRSVIWRHASSRGTKIWRITNPFQFMWLGESGKSETNWFLKITPSASLCDLGNLENLKRTDCWRSPISIFMWLGESGKSETNWFVKITPSASNGSCPRFWAFFHDYLKQRKPRMQRLIAPPMAFSANSSGFLVGAQQHGVCCGGAGINFSRNDTLHIYLNMGWVPIQKHR